MKRKNFFGLDQPLTHADHGKPMTRRDFVSQGFGFGAGIALGGSAFSLLGSSQAQAQLSSELQTLFETKCGGYSAANAKIPFICFDLAGGANFAGSNVLIGGAGGQRDFLSTSGYRKQGLPVDQTPNLDSAGNPLIDDSLGLLFHSDSGLLRGITEKAATAAPNINGAVIPARSENDTGNNPHNPMYQINKAGANGQLLALIGSRSSESGANSMAPAASINPEVRPTKVDRASDARGLVDTGQLTELLGNNQLDTDAVMESIYRLSNAKLGTVQTGLSQLPTTDEVVKDLVRCGYLQGALNAQQSPDSIDPELDPDIFGPDGIFTEEADKNDREFRKTASIMKLVIDGFAGAGTVTMGGYDYHTGDRATGEVRDLRAGRCIGACLEYARLRNKPLMVYVYSDGSVFSNGMIDNSAEGRGKGVWTGDNQQTAASFFLVHNPNGRPELVSPQSQQLGHMRASGDVETTATPVANNVNLLVDAVALNYMALNGDIGGYQALFGNPFGSNAQMESLIAFNAIT